jgi:hypothetical protein
MALLLILYQLGNELPIYQFIDHIHTNEGGRKRDRPVRSSLA